MKNIIVLFFSFSTVLFFSCQNQSTETAAQSQDVAFDQFKNNFIEQLWETYPGWATYEGYYKYADILTIPNQATRDKESSFINAIRDSLEKYPTQNLKPNNQTDFKMIQNFLNSNEWENNTFKSFEWNPSQYNVGGSINRLFISDYKSLDEKLRDISKKMINIPEYYLTAKNNLKNPTQEHTGLGIQQNEGALTVFGDKLLDSLNLSQLSIEEKDNFKKRMDDAKKSINDYISFLKGFQEKNKADKNNWKDFRIGEKLFSEKFDFDIVSGFSAIEMYHKALSHKKELHQEMAKISHQIWEKHMGKKEKPQEELIMIKQLIEKISERHVTRKDFIKSIRTQIPELTAFVKEKDLLYLDPSKPLKVRPTPEYMRGFAGASISSPGPYDKNAPTYYNVTPLDHYDDAGAESYLREYNYYVLQILNIHEAIPGHYAQLVYANKSPSLIKSILGNGAMVEGWAVYTERMMLEEGYGNHEPEMWLMYNKWNLRVTCNTIIDYGIHALGWDKEKVMDILLNEAFQEESEAKGKWKRATVSQVQLCSYFSGFKEIYEFREQLKKEQGEDFKLKDFHEQFLSYGSAPVKYVKELMME